MVAVQACWVTVLLLVIAAECFNIRGFWKIYPFAYRKKSILKSMDKSSTTSLEICKPVPHIIIIGAPASGKGSNCEIITKKLQIPHISTGDLLRAAVRDKTELGQKVSEYMNSGSLIPDDLMIDVVKKRLSEDDCISKGWILDGFPRTRAQAEAMFAMGIKPDVIVQLDVPEEVLVQRVLGRRMDPVTGKIYHLTFNPPSEPDVLNRLITRSDDTESMIRKRYGDYKREVTEITKFAGDKILFVDGTNPLNQTSTNILNAINRAMEMKNLKQCKQSLS